jgi:hypothetical protein
LEKIHIERGCSKWYISCSFNFSANQLFQQFPSRRYRFWPFWIFQNQIFRDVIMSSSLPFQSWWRNPSTSSTKEEIEEIFHLLQNYFHHTTNPTELIKTLSKESQETKNQLKSIRKENEKIKHKKVRLKSQIRKLWTQSKKLNWSIQNENEKNIKENLCFYCWNKLNNA